MRPAGSWAGETRTVVVPEPGLPTGTSVHVTLNRDAEGALREVFVTGRPNRRAEVNALCRILSLALQSGLAPEALARTMRGLRDSAAPVWWGSGPGAAVLSLPDALARLMVPEESAEAPEGEVTDAVR